MTYPFPTDIQNLIDQQMASGSYQTPDHLLRSALQQLAEQDQEWSAIQESIELLDNGDDGVPLDEAAASIRAKYNIPSGDMTAYRIQQSHKAANYTRITWKVYRSSPHRKVGVLSAIQ